MRGSRELVISQVEENLGLVSVSSVQLGEIEEAEKICVTPDLRRANTEESAVTA